MSAEVIAILTVGVSLGAVMISGQRTLRAEIGGVRRDHATEAHALRAEIRAVRTDLTAELREGLAAAAVERAAIRNDIHALAERVARLEGAVPFLVPRPLPAPEKPEPQPSA